MIKAVPGMTADWDFVRSIQPGLEIKRAVRWIAGARRAPAFSVVKPLRAEPTWMVFFLYCPTGELTSSDEFTLSRLRDLAIPVLVVCACEKLAKIPAKLAQYSDALIWKELSGFDFSGYSIALRFIASQSPGATAFVLNNSVLGPFSDLREFIKTSRWDLSGLTASSSDGNHIQSYAFVLRDVTLERMDQLKRVFPKSYAYNTAHDVVLCQELMMARVAHRHMAVGSHWYSRNEVMQDPTLVKPLELLDADFPFLKRSLLGKYRAYQATEEMRSRLTQLGHPEV